MKFTLEELIKSKLIDSVRHLVLVDEDTSDIILAGHIYAIDIPEEIRTKHVTSIMEYTWNEQPALCLHVK